LPSELCSWKPQPLYSRLATCAGHESHNIGVTTRGRCRCRRTIARRRPRNAHIPPPTCGRATQRPHPPTHPPARTHTHAHLVVGLHVRVQPRRAPPLHRARHGRAHEALAHAAPPLALRNHHVEDVAAVGVGVGHACLRAGIAPASRREPRRRERRQPRVWLRVATTAHPHRHLLLLLLLSCGA
jgi:hypothetical protein